MPSARTLSPTSGCSPADSGGCAAEALEALGVFVRVEVCRKPPPPAALAASLGLAVRPGVANAPALAGVLARDNEAEAWVFADM